MRTEGPLKDLFLTFSDRPKFVKHAGTLEQRYYTTIRANWAGSTNLEGAMKEVLDLMIKEKLPKNLAPTKLLILSDMQFNSCVTRTQTVYSSMREMYKKSGYDMPDVVFWQLNAKNDSSFPVKYDTDGTALISGYSPAILSSILQGKISTPEEIMKQVLMSKRYDL